MRFQIKVRRHVFIQFPERHHIVRVLIQRRVRARTAEVARLRLESRHEVAPRAATDAVAIQRNDGQRV